MSCTRQMNLSIGFGWSESVCNQSQYCLGVPMGKTSGGRMMYPYATHPSHKIGFKFLELPLLLLQETCDVSEAVNPGLKKILKQYVGHLAFPHNHLMTEEGIEPANQAHTVVCSLFY
eukprot:1693135-Ditylum_brightwellii.AAC.1